MSALRGFFALLAARNGSGGEVGALALDEALRASGPAVRSVLRAEGIVTPAPRATTWPCEEIDCEREVKDIALGRGGRRLVAVCTRAERGCEPVDLKPEDLAQENIAIDGLAVAIERALRLAPASGPAPIAGLIGVRWIGREIVGARRDVYFVANPRTAPMRALLAEIVVSGAKARVLVLTEGAVEPEIEARHAASDAITIDALDVILDVDDGRLVERRAPPRLRVVGAAASGAVVATSKKTLAPTSDASRCAALADLPPFGRWGEVTLFDVEEDDLVGLVVPGRATRRLSCVDLALADKRRKPIQAFELLKIICQGNGAFVTRRFGSSENGKRVMKDLRHGLRAAFGLNDDPFEPYSRTNKEWKPKFRALAASPKEMREIEREVAARKAKGGTGDRPG